MLQIVEIGYGTDDVRESGMARDVLDLFTVQPDFPAVAQAFGIPGAVHYTR